MPMNAEDGAHYGVNIKKDVIKVGNYKLVLEIQPSSDYLLHTDEETGVPVIKDGGKEAAAKIFPKNKLLSLIGTIQENNYKIDND